MSRNPRGGFGAYQKGLIKGELTGCFPTKQEDGLVEARRPLGLLLSDYRAKRYGLPKLVAVRGMRREGYEGRKNYLMMETDYGGGEGNREGGRRS